MANFAYTYFLSELLKAYLVAGADIRVALVMTNTTCDSEEDIDFIDQFTTLDEMDGANYARKAFANEAAAPDDANDRGEMDADDVTWTALGVGTRNVAGALLLKHVTNDTDSIAIGYITTGGFPFAASGANYTLKLNAEGLIQAAN